MPDVHRLDTEVGFCRLVISTVSLMSVYRELGRIAKHTVMARKDSTLNRSSRLIVMVSKEELSLIDEYRFQSHAPNRAAAVRNLLSKGLATRSTELSE